MGEKGFTIQTLRDLASIKGGKCLSNRYNGMRRHYRWRCAKGHEWSAKASDVKHSTWCGKCATVELASKRRISIDEMQAIAKKRGGKCLSFKYVNANTKLLWKCASGHTWEAKPAGIVQGRWCPKCAPNKKLDIDDARLIAREQGGRCLSSTYTNSLTDLKWKCAAGHVWNSPIAVVKNGYWCSECAGRRRRLTIADMKALALSRGGRCLSDAFVNIEKPLRWRCARGHEWLASPNGIRNHGSWCKLCARARIASSQRNSIEEYQAIALSRGGKLVSVEYKNNAQNLLWECGNGHQWKAKPLHIKRGGWCRECSSGIGERVCREYFEQLFGKLFPRIRPSWLKNKDGNQMELDGYNAELKLAFEHHGEQHYTVTTHYITSRHELERRRRDDREKVRLCRQNGITLIEIPEIPNRVPIEQLRDHLKQKLSKAGIRLPDRFDSRKVELKGAYQPDAIATLQEVAAGRGGRCLSTHYLGVVHKLEWKCRSGHSWKMSPMAVKSGQWCPECAGKKRLTIEDLQQSASEHGGWCLSVRYMGQAVKHQWRCKNGHTWKAKQNSIRRGAWCSECAGNKKHDIKTMQRFAKKHGGKCLSKEYLNSRTPLRWICHGGHVFMRKPHDIVTGRWCQKCAYTRRAALTKNSIEEMQVVARARGGRCLSKKYIGNKSKLTWECKNGHKWEAAPGNVKNRGSWCPTCSHSKKRQ